MRQADVNVSFVEQKVPFYSFGISERNNFALGEHWEEGQAEVKKGQIYLYAVRDFFGTFFPD